MVNYSEKLKSTIPDQKRGQLTNKIKMENEIKYRPILFSTPMVQAVDENRKKQTRRTKGLEKISLLATEVVKSDQWKSQGDWVARFKFKGEEKYEATNIIKCPYGDVGDVLWVRESYSHNYFSHNDHAYKADWDNPDPDIVPEPKWKPSIHMPKEACRIFLKITNIRVERLQDISEEDSKLEGIHYKYDEEIGYTYKHYLKEKFGPSPIHSFQTLWESINGKESWDSNPWVWVIEFEKIEKPEDWK
jgi:hypothetical protein